MTRRLPQSMLVLPLLLTGGCAMDASNSTRARPGAEAQLFDAAGREAGYVLLSQKGDALTGLVRVNGIAPGPHAIHIHTTGRCEAPAFASAGGHLNPGNRQHGLDNPLGAHAGDLRDLIVGPDGNGQTVFETATSLATVLDADGAAFVVHAGPDDNRTDPSGNSGGRILCGVLAPVGATATSPARP